MIKYILTAILIATLFLIKPISISFAQDYLYFLLEKEVKITSLTLIPLEVKACIGNKNNKIVVEVVQLYPFNALANYNGNINAFDVYQPFSARGEANATIIYDKKLLVDGVAFINGSQTKVIVKQLEDNWYITTNTKDLTLKDGNRVDLKTELNIDINNTVKFDIHSIFTLPKFHQTAVDTTGIYNDDIIKASAKISFKDKIIDINKLDINTTDLTTSLQTTSFGGYLNSSYKDNYIYYDAKNLHLSKVFKFIKLKQLAQGYINLKGKFDIKNQTTSFSFHSPKITAQKQVIKNIKLTVPDLKIIDKKITSSYKMDAEILDHMFSFKGDVAYKDGLELNARSDDFDGKTQLHIKDKKFKLSMKELNIPKLLNFASQKPYADGLVTLNAYGDKAGINYLLDANTSIKDINIKLKSDGSYDIKSKLLKSDFQASVPLKGDSLEVYGDLNYQNSLTLNVKSSSFDSQTLFKMDDNNFTFDMQGIDLNKLTKALKRKQLFGYLDFKANGKNNFKDIDFKVYSSWIKRNLLLGKIDNSLGLNISGNYTPELLTLKDNFTLNYEEESIPIKLNASIHLAPPYKTKASFFHNEDKIIIKSFSYEKEQIKTNFLVEIQELHKYRGLTRITLYGPLILNAKYTDILHINTNSLGGDLNLRLEKKLLTININKVHATKVNNLLFKETFFAQGYIEGNATYDITQKIAHTNISVFDTYLHGIDIDNYLSNLKNSIGLNVIKISKSLVSSIQNIEHNTTHIKHLEFDVSLKNNAIKLNDVAASTDNFLLSTSGSIFQDGEINRLNIHILNRKGCAVITQGLKDNIKNPTIIQNSDNIENIVKMAKVMPSSILKKGEKIIDFGTNTVDNVATFGVKNIFLIDTEVSLTSDVINLGSSIIDSTSNMVLPIGCTVVYDGKVRYPLKK